MLKPRNNLRPACGPAIFPDWIVMTDEQRLPVSPELVSALPYGSTVIVRNRDQSRALADACAVREVASRQGVGVSVSLSVPVEGPLPVDGLHLPERSLAKWKATDLHRLRPGFVTTSAHSRPAAWRGWCAGADAVLLSPVLPTTSHPKNPTLGVMRFAAIARACPFPVYALGGITAPDVVRLLRLGSRGIAGISLFAAPMDEPEK